MQNRTRRIMNKLEILSLNFCYLFLIIAAFLLPFNVTAFNISLILAVFCSLLNGHWLEKWKRISHNPILWASLIFLIYVLISCFIPHLPNSNKLTILHKYGKIIFLIFLMPLFFEETLKSRVIFAFALAVTITLFMSYLKYFNLLPIFKHNEPADLFRNYIQTSFLFCVLFAIIASKLNTNHKPKFLLSLVLLAAITFALFVFSTSRTGYLIFCILLFYFAFSRFNLKGLIICSVVTSLFLVFAYFYSYQFNASIKQILYKQQSNTSISLRESYLKNSFHLIKQHPILGNGTGSFKPLYFNHFGTVPLPNESHLRTPHNQYVMIMVEQGIIGLMLFLSIFFIQWYYANQLSSEKQHLAKTMLIIFAVGCACDALLYASTTGYFYVFFSALYFGDIPYQRVPVTKSQNIFTEIANSSQ